MSANKSVEHTRHIGIMGGTFDPIHTGHLIIAEQARYELELEKMIFIPAACSPLKTEHPKASAEDRLRMVQLATEDNPAFVVSNIEIERDGLSYTVDTLESLKTTYGNETKLYFITGADAIADILRWRRPEQIVELASVLSLSRPGYSLEEAKSALPAEFRERITFIEAPGIEISATDLRKRVSLGKSIKYLVPHTVERYITKRELYRTV